jgi:HlyD family secretion protein/epimerase transport system membrane fusion protein
MKLPGSLQEAVGAARSFLKRVWDSFGAPETSEDSAIDGVPATASFLDTKRVVRSGSMIVLGFVLVFFGWAGLAPLASAVLAPGVVVVETHRKTIQHLEGGIVREVRVIEGQDVRAGDVLMQLDDTQARAQLDLLEGEAIALAAQEARLTAERDGLNEIRFPADLTARAGEQKVTEALEGERRAFVTRRDTLRRQIDIFRSRKAENDKIVEGLRAQETSFDTQLGLITKETTMVQQLVERGIEGMPRLLALQRAGADLSGRRGEVVQRMAQVSLDTGEIDLQIINLQNERRSEILAELREVQTRRFDLVERIRSARDVLNRTAVLSPDNGKVVGLSVHTSGGVVRPGEALMEVVPQDDQLDVDAHVRPEDVDDVRIGGEARVTLTAFNSYELPSITGTVTALSADRLVDQRTGLPYFNAKVVVDRDALDEFTNVRLVPGMPVEVAIGTGSRTMLEYLLEPVQAVMRRGMRER